MLDDSSSVVGSSRLDPQLTYRRLRAPSNSGDSLQEPPLQETIAQWNKRDCPVNHGVDVEGASLSALRSRGRAEVLKLALKHTLRYRDFDMGERGQDSIVMSGHQPSLFHPGVWFKNFALSAVAREVDATPINLVVDNDVCGNASIKCPAYRGGKASIKLVEFDGSHSAVPYETRPIVDESIFGSFGLRAAKHVSDCFESFGKQVVPLVSELWTHVDAVRQSLGMSAFLGTALAAGRHRLEQDWGLETLEVPVSSVAQTRAFANFAADIIVDQTRFNAAYNARVLEYRRLHRIRSDAHPVPELRTDDKWIESPFWIWTVGKPLRRRLFVKQLRKEIELTDRVGWSFRVETKQLADAWGDLNTAGIALRPRALITTMYCRMVLSDLFLHGIGGAKYDQLTDVIAHDFFGVTLPKFSTLTATFHLPLGYPPVRTTDESALRQCIRERRFHPEQFIDQSGPAKELITRKRAAIDYTQLSRIDRHREIEETNHLLQPFVASEVEELEQMAVKLTAQIRDSRILNSREYSFCLFPEALIGNMKRMVEGI